MTNSVRTKNRFATGGVTVNTNPNTNGAAGHSVIVPGTPASTSRPHSRSVGRGRGRPNALVVDDVKVTQVVTSAAMFNAGYISEVAADGVEAVEMAKATHYEVILMDVAVRLFLFFVWLVLLRRFVSDFALCVCGCVWCVFSCRK